MMSEYVRDKDGELALIGSEAMDLFDKIQGTEIDNIELVRVIIREYIVMTSHLGRNITLAQGVMLDNVLSKIIDLERSLERDKEKQGE